MLPQACRAAAVQRSLEVMEVHFAPDLQAKIDQWVRETGRPVEELIEDAFAGYAEAFFEGLRQREDEILKEEYLWRGVLTFTRSRPKTSPIFGHL